MKNLNTYQKIALAIAGVFILLIQLMKFLDEGIQGASWIFSFSISALLFVPLLSDVDRIFKRIKPDFLENDDSKYSKDIVNKKIIGELFKELGAKAENLHTLIANKSKVEAVPFFNVISDTWFPSIAAIVVLTHGVAKKCDEIDYYETEEFKILNEMLLNLLMSISKHQDKLIDGAQTDDNLLRKSMSIVFNARKSVDLMFENIKTKQANVDEPVHIFIKSACGFTDEFYKELERDVKRQLNGLFVTYSNSTRLS
jgi:hypothetical protein